MACRAFKCVKPILHELGAQIEAGFFIFAFLFMAEARGFSADTPRWLFPSVTPCLEPTTATSGVSLPLGAAKQGLDVGCDSCECREKDATLPYVLSERSIEGFLPPIDLKVRLKVHLKA